jgi:tetratricopeptide (TPR) repeat protein
VRAGLLGTLLLCSCQDLSLRAAHRAAAEGHLEEAVARFGPALRDHPDDLQVRLALSAALLRLGRLDEARLALAPALTRRPLDGVVARTAAELALAQGQPAQALEALTDAPGEPEVALLRARARLARGGAGDAAQALSELSACPADRPRGAYLRSQALLSLGRFDEAEAALRDLEGPAPDWARYGLARLAAAQGERAAALQGLASARAAAGPRWRPEVVAADPAFDFAPAPHPHRDAPLPPSP